MVGAFQKQSSDRRVTPIHSILKQHSRTYKKVGNGYDYIIQGEFL